MVNGSKRQKSHSAEVFQTCILSNGYQASAGNKKSDCNVH